MKHINILTTGHFSLKAKIEEIREEIKAINSMVAGVQLEGISREELLSRESHIQEAVDSLCQLLEEHATREEIILEMAQRVLEEKKQQKSQ